MSSDTKKREIISRIVRIRLTDGTMINGQINLNRNPGFDRLSDLIENQQEDFLVMFDAAVYEPGAETPVKQKTLMLNKRHIFWAAPEETQK